MIGSGEGEVIVEELAELLGEGRGELWATIRDDFVVEPKAEVYFVEKRAATPSAVMVFFVGHRITPFIRPWLTMTSKESKPAEVGRSVIRSQETCWKGQEAWDLMGVSGGTVGCVFDLFCWHMAQPSMYLRTNCVRPGHQNSEVTSWRVLR